MKYARIVAVQIQDDGRRGAIQEVQAPRPSAPAEAKAAHPMPWQAGQMRFSICQGNADHIDQLLPSTLQAPTQAEQALPLVAECAEADVNGLTIGPEDRVTLERNLVFLAILGWVSLQ